MTCDACGEQVVASPAITAAGGWCAPTETLYSFTEPSSLCSDCRSRQLFVLNLGIDPGPRGENLRCQRGGIKFGETDG